jgi:hypothetical protein
MSEQDAFDKLLIEKLLLEQQAEINTVKGSREKLEAARGKVWDTDELAEEFSVVGFMTPYVVVRRKSDGQRGSLQFQHAPRFYFNWEAA